MGRLSAIGLSVAALALANQADAGGGGGAGAARAGGQQQVEGQAGAGEGRRVGPYKANIADLARENTAYRRVLFTGARSQIVAMSIPPGQDIGEEKHLRVEQIIVIVSGTGRSTLDGVESPMGPGDVIVITPGTEHDVVNTGSAPLKLYTIYTPPNHIDGRVHPTKADAERDAADEELGRRVESGAAAPRGR